MSKEVSKTDKMGFRVSTNAEWIERCTQLYAEDNARNGAFAREVREKSGKSLRRVAEAMGISAMFLSDLERGNRMWNTSHVGKWKAAMQEGGDAH
jgi:hypothetical protein